jgi:hypothetical protein
LTGTDAIVLRIVRWVAGGCWIFQGLVPKILGPHADERAMLAAVGVAPTDMATIATAAGAAEIALGLCILLLPRKAWPHVAALFALAALLAFVAVRTPAYLGAAFNPVVGNATLAALSVVALVLLQHERRRR